MSDAMEMIARCRRTQGPGSLYDLTPEERALITPRGEVLPVGSAEVVPPSDHGVEGAHRDNPTEDCAWA